MSSTPVLLRPAFILGAKVAATASDPVSVKDELQGEFVVEPGGALVMQAVAAAGTSPLVLLSATWQEVAAA